MSILYCRIPHFPLALTLGPRGPAAVLLDPSGRVLDADPHAIACGVRAGQSARLAQLRCPQARLVEADLDGCRQAMEALLDVLEQASDRVEPHGWGAAYVDLQDGARSRGRSKASPRACTGSASYQAAAKLCIETGRAIRRALGDALEPALGWDQGKFTAHAAARSTRPGRVLPVDKAHERTFLDPLPVGLLPLGPDPLRRLRFLGLRTLGQYAALPPGAVWQQFGHAGVLALRCARGEDERPVIARREAPRLAARQEYEAPLADRARLRAALQRLLAPLVEELHADLYACGRVRLTVECEDGAHKAQDGRRSVARQERVFVTPVTDGARLLEALEQLVPETHQVDGRSVHGRSTRSKPGGFPEQCGAMGVSALEIALEELQDATGCRTRWAMEQLSFLPTGPAADGEDQLRQVQRYLAARFGASCLRRAIVQHPHAPLAEWQVGWVEVDDG